MKKTLYLLTLLIIISLSVFVFNSALAVEDLLDIKSGLNAAATGQTGAGYDATQANANTIPAFIGQIVRVVLSFVGAIFFILIILSGIQWMTAGGNEEKVTKARTRLINATIGLAITIAAYFITWFISNTLLTA